jgi:peptide/nickel transport system permease protein
MAKFLIKRIYQSLVTLVLLSMFIFALSRLSGDPVMLLASADATAEDIALLRHSLALDKPIAVQYAVFIANAAKGDFGISLRAKRPVGELLLQRYPNSLKLGGVAFVFAFLVSLPLGVTSAVRKGGKADMIARVIAVFGQATPSFWLGIVLIEIFAGHLGVLPSSGMGGPVHYILPAFTAGLFIVAGLTRLLRSSMLDALDSEYVKLCRAKGLSELVVIWKHALRNALIPALTFASMYLAIMITQLIVVETVFAWPGIGRLSYEAIMFRDFPVIQAVVLSGALIVIIVNVLTDILYAYIDPRIRYR